MRDRLKESFARMGIDPDALARGEGGDALIKVMEERSRALQAVLGSRKQAGTGSQPSSKRASISIDKAWHGVHYLLCGKAEPDSSTVSQAVMGGTEIGEDLGYGPARYFEPDKVAGIARELSRANLEAEMTARFEPDKMASLGVYPGQFLTGDEKWLMDAFRQLRQFYVDASAAKLAVVTCLE